MRQSERVPGRRELPNARVQLDGPVEPLSKDGTFLGRHIRTTLPGVAVQINAFNFPVWGALEKLAPAFLAGMPTIVKPATPGAYVTEHLDLVVAQIPAELDQFRRVADRELN